MANTAGDPPVGQAAARWPWLRWPRLGWQRLRWRRPRLRLLPAIILVASLMLWVRVEDFSQDLSDLPMLDAGRPSLAEEAPAAGGEVEPASVGNVAGQMHLPATVAATVEADGSTAETVAEASPGAAFDPEAMTQSELAVLQDLAHRRDELDEREGELRRREALLAVAEQRLDEKMAELATLRTQIEEMLQRADTQQQVQLDSLVRIYEAMRPSDAAAIFNGLELGVLINVFEHMSERKSAPILAGMNPERAREVTAHLAERRRAGMSADPQ